MNTPGQAPMIPWAAIPIFQSLAPSERESLRSLSKVRAYEEAETIFREGDPATNLHFVIGGKVKIVKSAPSGRDIILEILGTGDPVGVVAAYEGRSFPASAVALEACTLLSVPADEFFGLLGSNPALCRGMLLGLTRRMMEMTRKLAERSSRVDYRIARLFLTLSARGDTGDDGSIHIPFSLSRQEIADMVGTTQETAIRVMSRWGKEGVLITEEAGFLIPDPARLREVPPGD